MTLPTRWQEQSLTFVLTLVALIVSRPGSVAAEEPKADAGAVLKKYALLVGCTEYPNSNKRIRPLAGPVNDARLLSRILTEGFQFPSANVTRLVGWPDKVTERPTRANIAAAFDALVARAAPDVQIVILLSGHGTQVPIPEKQDPLDPKNREPDGLDEVFLPADVKTGENGLENGLRDDDIGAWLTAMKNKGAAVWVIFDSCHSGTMTRAVDPVEVSRTVEAEELGISQKKIEEAVKRAREAVTAAEKAGLWKKEDVQANIGALGRRTDKEGMGSVVAFYAAQPFEEAPELPRPADAPRTPEHRHGMLTYTLCKALEERGSPLSYRELALLVDARYRAERASRPPTPFAEAPFRDEDLDRQVLGANVWKKRADILLKRGDGGLSVSAGALRGLTAGSVLAVHPPPGDARPAEVIIGYVKVLNPTVADATVEPCAFEKQSVVDAAKLPDLARCEVVSQDLGDMRVKLAVGLPTDPKDVGQQKLTDNIKSALANLDEQVKPLTQIVGKAEEAEWRLRAVTPEEAEEKFGAADWKKMMKGPEVFLLHGLGRKPDPKEEAAGARQRIAGLALSEKVYGRYSADDPKRMTEDLDRDLQKIFKWQNVCRVAGTLGAAAGGKADNGLRFTVNALKDRNDKSGGKPLQDAFLEAGRCLEFRLKNDGTENLWVTMLYLDPNFGIEVYYSGQIEAGQPFKAWQTEVTGDSSGVEGMVVFALPVDAKGVPPNYKYLEQEPLGVEEAAKRGPNDAPDTPFGRLLAAAAFNRGDRSLKKLVSTTPAIFSRTWITIPTRP